MDTMEIVYFTCLNKDCERYRNIFSEGDPQHDDCARERLWLEGQRPSVPMWAWAVMPVALMLAAGGVMLFLRSKRSQPPKRPMYGEERPTRTWSGTERHSDERRGHPVPPPIV